MNACVVLIGYDRIHIDVLNASEDILLHLRIDLFKLCNEIFYLQSLRHGAAVWSTGSAGISEFAGTLYEMQIVVVAPVLDLRFSHKIKGTDKLHAIEVGTVELRHHSLNLSAVEHTHEDSFYNVIEMMSEGYFIAA